VFYNNNITTATITSAKITTCEEREGGGILRTLYNKDNYSLPTIK